MGSLFSFVIIIAIFYFFLYAPQKKQQNKVKDMMNSLKVGDVIVTRGGIHGTIVAIDSDMVTIASGPDRVRINITRQGVGSVVEQAPISEEIQSETAVDEQTTEESGKINLEKKEE